MNKKINLEKQSAQATKWSLITELIAKIISPITNMILARILLPEAFGAIATITMVISFAEVFTDAGFQKYIIQKEFTNEKELNKSINVAFWTNLIFSFIAVIAIIIFKKNIAYLVGTPELSKGIAVASISIILVGFSSIQIAVYRRNFDFKTLFYVRMATALIPLLITVPLAFIFKNYWALIIGTILMQIVQAIVLTFKSSWKIKFYYSLKYFKEMFSFSSWTLLESITIWFTGYIGIFIIGNKLDSYYLGLYRTSIATVNAYMGIITSAVTPVLFATLSRYQNDEVLFKETYFKFQRLLAVLIIPMGVGIYIFHDLVTIILLGENWIETSNFIGLWGLMSSLTISISYFSSEVYRSKGKPQISLVAQIIHLCFLIPTIYYSVLLDFETLYIARSLIRIQGIITGLIILQILFGIKIKDVIKNLLPQTLSALIMGILGYSLLKVSQNILWQFISIIICVIFYFVVLCMFKDIRKEIFEIEVIDKIIRKIKIRFKTSKF